MKRILLFACAVMAAMVSNATTYTAELVTKAPAGTEFTPVTTTAEVTKNSDGTYNFKLNNWMYGQGGRNMGIGTVEFKNVTGTVADGVTTINAEATQSLTKGDDSSIGYWLATYLGQCPMTLLAKFTDTKLYAHVIVDGSESNFRTVYDGTFGTDDFGSIGTGVAEIEVDSAEEAIFDLSGMRVTSTLKKGIYVVRHSDGSVTKIIRK